MFSDIRRLSLFKRIDRINKHLLFGLIVGFQLLVFYQDYTTGPLTPGTVFYFLPVIVASFFLSLPATILIVLTSAFCSFLVFYQLLHVSNLYLISYNVIHKIIIFSTVSAAIYEIRKLVNQLEEMASKDYLTKVYTRHYFYEMSIAELARAHRYKYPDTLLFIDLDNFKQVNDTLGHEMGDRVLIKSAMAIKASLRDVDLLGRFGGDEFAVLLHKADENHAQKIIERMRKNLADELKPLGINVTFSIGGAITNPGNLLSVDHLIRLADSAMYQVKQNTKNDSQFIFA